MSDKKEKVVDPTHLDDSIIIQKRRNKIHEAFSFWKNIDLPNSSSPSLKINRRSSAIFEDVPNFVDRDSRRNTVVWRNRANTSARLDILHNYHDDITLPLKHSKNEETKTSIKILELKNDSVKIEEMIPKESKKIIKKKENDSEHIEEEQTRDETILKNDVDTIEKEVKNKDDFELKDEKQTVENQSEELDNTIEYITNIKTEKIEDNTNIRTDKIEDNTNIRTDKIEDNTNIKTDITEDTTNLKINIELVPDLSTSTSNETKRSEFSSKRLSGFQKSSDGISKKSHKKNLSGEELKPIKTKERSYSVVNDLHFHDNSENSESESDLSPRTLTRNRRRLNLLSALSLSHHDRLNSSPKNKEIDSKTQTGSNKMNENSQTHSKRNSFGGDIYSIDKKQPNYRHSLASAELLRTTDSKSNGTVKSQSQEKKVDLESFFKNRTTISKRFRVFNVPLDMCVLTREAPDFVIDACESISMNADSLDWHDTFENNSLTPKDLMVIKKSIETNSMDLKNEKDSKLVANGLLLFLKELPDPVCTSRYYNSFLYLADVKDTKYRFRLAHSLLHTIPAQNRTTFQYLIKFIGNLSDGSDKKLKKLCMFFGSSLLRFKEDSASSNLVSSGGKPLLKSSSDMNIKRADKRLSEKNRRKHSTTTSKILYFIASNRENLFKLSFADKIFAWSKGNLFLESSDLSGLLEMLTDEFYVDNDLPNMFFLNSVWIIDPVLLFKKIMTIYDEQTSDKSFSARRRAKILMILKLWFKLHGAILINNKKFISKVEQKVEKPNLPKEESLFWKDLHNTLKLQNVTPIKAEQQKPLNQIFQFDIFDYDPKKVACTLSIIDLKNFKAIRPEECLQKAFCDEKKGTNFFKMAEQFNKLNLWVQTCIVDPPNKRDRVTRIIFFTSVLAELIEIKNFNSSLAIFTALTSTALSKLTKSWSKIGRKFIKTLESAEELFSVSNNYRNYNLKLKECHLPVIPQIVIISRNIFAIEENMETEIDGKFNVEKMRSIYGIVKEIQKYQKSEYNFERTESLISQFDNLVHKTEEDLLDMCQSLEKKQ